MAHRMNLRTRGAIAAGFTLLSAACGDGSGTEEAHCDAADGVICTYVGNGVAGLGEDGQKPLEVSLYLPQDLSFSDDGQPYILDWNNHRVRTVVDGAVQTVIGTGELGDAPDGPALKASLNHPTHITFDPEGNIILSAWHNSKVMRYDVVKETLTTLCGDGQRNFGGDGGPATKAILDLPVATGFDSQERLVIMDQANQRIRRIEDDGTIQTIVGPDGKFLPVPEGYTQVCSTDPMTEIETCKLCDTMQAETDPAMCPGRKPQSFGGDGGPGTEAFMYQPFSQSAPPAGRMEFAPDGTLYFCDTGNHRIRALSKDGDVRTVAGSGPDEFDREFEGGYDGDGGKATKALLQRPTDVAVGKGGTLFIADTLNSCIRKVDADGIIETVAGRCTERGDDGDNGPATEASLDRPYGIALDGEGNLYIADTHNHRVRVVYGVDR
jgi:hypothetical protein